MENRKANRKVNRKKNRRIKTVFRTCMEQWKGELLTPRTYMGYLVGISMVLIIAGNYMGYANGRNVQIFEPVIIALSDPSYSIFIMLGLLLTLLDAPFINARTPYLVTRGSRKSWYSGTLFYMYTQIVVYYALIFAATVATGFSRMYLRNSWSVMAYRLATQRPMDALEIWGLDFDASALISVLSPARVFLILMCLQILYSAVLLTTAYVINMNHRNSAGNFAALLLHLAGVVIYKSWGGDFLKKLSLYERSQITTYTVSESGIVGFVDNVLIYLIVTAVILAAGRIILKHMDYNTGRAGREL